MQYEILHKDAFPIIKCDLQKGELMKAESDAMIAMSTTLDVSGSLGGSGFFGGLARKMFTKQSFFLQEVNATRGPGTVLFGHPAPGGIIDVELDGSYGMRVQKNGFLAATQNVKVNTAVQNLMQGFFSKEGFFVLHITGEGTVFLSSYGAIHPIELAEGEEVVIDNGHLVAWPDFMQYKIKKASNGWFSSMASGECLVCHFKGPGVVLIQTRNPDGFREWLTSLATEK